MRPGGEQSFAAPIGHNESESHLMGLERTRISEPSLRRKDEGRREPFEANHLKSQRSKRLKQLATVQRTGGVGGSSILGSISKRSRETLHNEVQTSTIGTSSSNSKAWRIMQGVRVLHSSDEAAVMVVE